MKSTCLVVLQSNLNVVTGVWVRDERPHDSFSILWRHHRRHVHALALSHILSHAHSHTHSLTHSLSLSLSNTRTVTHTRLSSSVFKSPRVSAERVHVVKQFFASSTKNEKICCLFLFYVCFAFVFRNKSSFLIFPIHCLVRKKSVLFIMWQFVKTV